MNKEDIKIGQTVRVVTGVIDGGWIGTEYVVTEHRPTSYDSTRELVAGKVTKSSIAAVGATVQFHTHQLELVEPKKEELQVGDKVRYIGGLSPDWEGLEGVLEDVRTPTSTFRITKGNAKHEVGKVLWPYLANLEKIEPFTFDDIKVGDKVRRTETWESGTVLTTEGVVVGTTFSRALTKENVNVALHTDRQNPHVKLELLERPEPHFTETAEVGTRYRVKSNISSKTWFLLTKLDNGQWERVDVLGGVVGRFDPEDAKRYFDEREHALIK